MKKKQVGYLILGISVLIGFIIYSFNVALRSIVSTACSHGPTCPMWGTINVQTSISLAFTFFIAFFGLYLIFFGKEPKDKLKSKFPGDISQEEQSLLDAIIQSEGTIFQSDLVEKTEMSKVKITRILDRLEGKGLIERKRRGMTNVVILRQ
jgi:uncharacterized membrane protein